MIKCVYASSKLASHEEAAMATNFFLKPFDSMRKQEMDHMLHE